VTVIDWLGMKRWGDKRGKTAHTLTRTSVGFYT